MDGFINVVAEEELTYFPVNGFTTTDLGCERGHNLVNLVSKIYAPECTKFIAEIPNTWDETVVLNGEITKSSTSTSALG